MSETLTNGVIVPDKGSRDWYADLRSNWLKLDSLMAGGNVTINPAQTDGILVATITVGGKEYKLYQQDGDVSVKIDPSAENAEYPLVASTSAEANTGSVVMAPAVTVNPSTGAVTATSFKGKLDGNASTATNATKAVQDGAGAVITDTYATKKELGSKADDDNVVHKSGTETIAGTKTFSDVTCFNKELRYKDTKYDWTNTSLDTWCDAGHVSWSDKTNNRRMHELVGTKGGVWTKACYINENLYFNVDSNRNIAYDGTTFTWNRANILTDANRMMLAKNLSGTNITPGGVVDCGNGNGMLVGEGVMNPAGARTLANTKPTGKWKSTSNFSLGAEESGIFVKVG